MVANLAKSGFQPHLLRPVKHRLARKQFMKQAAKKVDTKPK